MDIQEIVRQAYLDGIIEGGVMAKVNMNFDIDGMAEDYVQTKVKNLNLLNVSDACDCEIVDAPSC